MKAILVCDGNKVIGAWRTARKTECYQNRKQHSISISLTGFRAGCTITERVVRMVLAVITTISTDVYGTYICWCVHRAINVYVCYTTLAKHKKLDYMAAIKLALFAPAGRHHGRERVYQDWAVARATLLNPCNLVAITIIVHWSATPASQCSRNPTLFGCDSLLFLAVKRANWSVK